MPLAIKRTEEFTRYVHPLLQAYCAKCHDASYEGGFQLVPMKPRDRNSDALRANLDATLRLIDQNNPSHSVLLSSTLRPHGRSTKPRPIFPGSNDKAYKVLAEWASHLVAPKDGDDAARRQASRDAMVGSQEVFAFDRNRSAQAENDSGRPEQDARQPAPARPVPPVRSSAPTHPMNSPSHSRFPALNPRWRAPRTATGGPATRRPAAADPSKPPVASARTKAAPTPVDGDDDDDLDDDLPVPPRAKPGAAAVKKPAKPLSIDPKLLERALQNRNAARSNPGN